MSEKAKLGAGHAKAMLRLGLRELREATIAFPDSIAKEEIGIYGTAIPQDVVKDREPSKDREPA